MRCTIYGDVEPGHVIEKAHELKQQRNADPKGAYPWIQTAPTFDDVDYVNPSPEFKAFLARERAKLYRSVDTRTGEIFLIKNPYCWEWVECTNGRERGHFVRPKAIPTGIFLERKESKNKQERRS